MPFVSARVDFYPVGQGLFSFGQVEFAWLDRRFSWIFDCGTSSASRLVDSAIADIQSRLAGSAESRPVLDIVCISHFDRDHVNGLTKILESFNVRMLLLPLLPLYARLAILAVEEADEELTSFVLEPAAFVKRRAGGDVERIIFIGPGGSPEKENDSPEGGNQPSDEGRFRIETSLRNPSGEDEHALVDAAQGVPGNSRVEFLREGSPIRVENRWEFVPYNDGDTAKKVTVQFLARARELAERLQTAGSARLREEVLDSIVVLYDRQFGRSALWRNKISTFLYAGPVTNDDYAAFVGIRRFKGVPDHRGLWQIPQVAQLFAWLIPTEKSGAGFLYCGDGYLNRPSHLNALLSYFGKHRIDQVQCFQVMHHGARRNWHPGVPSLINPLVSVFSSDPKRPRTFHPHKEVWDSFLSNGAEQVDASIGLSVHTVVLG